MRLTIATLLACAASTSLAFNISSLDSTSATPSKPNTNTLTFVVCDDSQSGPPFATCSHDWPINSAAPDQNHAVQCSGAGFSFFFGPGPGADDLEGKVGPYKSANDFGLTIVRTFQLPEVGTLDATGNVPINDTVLTCTKKAGTICDLKSGVRLPVRIYSEAS